MVLVVLFCFVLVISGPAFILTIHAERILVVGESAGAAAGRRDEGARTPKYTECVNTCDATHSVLKSGI